MHVAPGLPVGHACNRFNACRRATFHRSWDAASQRCAIARLRTQRLIQLSNALGGVYAKSKWTQYGPIGALRIGEERPVWPLNRSLFGQFFHLFGPLASLHTHSSLRQRTCWAHHIPLCRLDGQPLAYIEISQSYSHIRFGMSCAHIGHLSIFESVGWFVPNACATGMLSPLVRCSTLPTKRVDQVFRRRSAWDRDDSQPYSHE